VVVLGAAGHIAWLAWVASLPEPEYTGWTVSLGGGRMGSVEYGVEFGRLAYVVFQERRESISGVVVQEERRRGDPVVPRLSVPDGGLMRLPGDHQLYEIIDGELATSDRRVSKEDLDAFLDAGSEEYTIDALLEFTDRSGR